MLNEFTSRMLAEVASALFDAGGLDEVYSAVASGRLSPDSTAPVVEALSGGSLAAAAAIQRLQALWRGEGSLCSGPEVAAALRVAGSMAALHATRSGGVQVVWTGPDVIGSHLRATREVVREIVRKASEDILVVGYWITANKEAQGIIEEFIRELAAAVVRDVEVTIIVDERVRPDGRDNRSVLWRTWPAGVQHPRLLTWRLPSEDPHLKLHAKVLVADRRDALVTSANLTSQAMDRNIEMGVRVGQSHAELIADHFRRLEAAGILVPFTDSMGS
ncbi:MAG: DISARM system phospholipase D-like protein DrmC [Phycisphaerales bacterium]|nr:DISARM system phospholipase D-like protein DrmC [Phycisphaerales bacterium]